MRVPDIIELENLCGFCFEHASRRLIDDFLHRNIRNGKLRSTKDKTAKECEVDPAWHLKQRIESVDRIETAQPSGETHAASTAQHLQRIHEGSVAHQIEHGIDLLAIAEILREVGRLNLTALGSKFLEHVKPLFFTGRCDDSRAHIVSNVQGCTPQRRSRAANYESLAFLNLKVTQQARLRATVRKSGKFAGLRIGW